MDPMTIMALIQAATSAAGAMKGGPGPEGAGLPAADSGAGNIFGENTQAAMLPNARSGTSVAPYSAGPAAASPLMGPSPAIASIAPPQAPIAPAKTYSEGVKAQNIAPPTGGSTGGEISAGASPLEWQGPPQPYEAQGPPMPYEPQGPPMPYEPQGPPLPPGMGPMGAVGGDPRLQEMMGMLGPMAGMAGAAAGAGGANRAPGSGGFPARPFQMAPSLASLPPRRRY
jgi:hypothetical protein